MKTMCNSAFFWFVVVMNVLAGAVPLQGQQAIPDRHGNKSAASPVADVSSACPTEVDAGPDFYVCNQAQVTRQLMGSRQGIAPKVLYWEGIPNSNTLNPIVTVNQTTTFKLVAWSLDSTINLIVNPDFEQGVVGFVSEYKHNPGDLVPPQMFDVLPKPGQANPTYPPNCTDHTTGSGLMLANSPTMTDPILWSQTVAVQPETYYYFSGWTTRFRVKGFLRAFINGQFVVGAAGPMNCGWGHFSGIWYSGGSTSAKIDLIQPLPVLQDAGALAIDDLFFSPLCKSEDSMTIHMTSMQAVAAPSPSLHLCEGYEITLSGAGSSVGPLVTYQWNTADGNIVSGANTLYPVVNAPGTYHLTVTLNDPNYQNCTATATTVVVEAINQPTAWISYFQTLNCVQKQTTLTANAGFGGNYTYQWEAANGGNILNGVNAKNVLVNAPGTYTVTITDTNTGCSAVAEQEVEGDTQVPTANANANAITCLAQASTLSGAGSSAGPGIYYAWSTPNGQINWGKDSLIAGTNQPGTYILRVTNAANFCTSTDTVIVTANTTLPRASILPPDSVSCLLPSVTLVATEDSLNVHLRYAWTTAQGNIVTGAHTPTPVVNAPGWYVLSLTDTLNGCLAVDSVRVEADTNAIIAIANAPSELTCAHATVTLNADGSTVSPDLTYAWTTADGNIVSGAASPTPVVDRPGVYQLLLSDPGSGCSATDLAIVTINDAPPQVTVAPPADFTCLLNSQTLLAQNAAPGGSFTYQWTASNGGNITAGADSTEPAINAPGTYTLVTFNLENGCSATTSVQVGADIAPPATQIAVSGVLHCNATLVTLTNTSDVDPGQLAHTWTAPDGAVTNTGVDPAFAAAQPGAYLLTLTNLENGCTATASATVSQLDPVGVEWSEQTNVSCFGASDGALSATASGGDGVYTYLWDNAGGGNSQVSLPAGAYTLVVTDGTGCTASINTTITEPALLTPNAAATPPTVVGGSDGSVSASPTGGVPSYTFVWNTGAAQALVTGLPAGMYTVTVTDANGCTAEQTVEVWGGACDVAAGIDANNPACRGSADGSAEAVPLGGAGPYTYLWSNGQTGPVADNLPAGTYTVLVTDVNGCQAEASAELNDPAELVMESDGILDASCPETPDGLALVRVSGGTGNITVTWSNGAQGLQANNLTAGEYTATATDGNGCTQTLTVTVLASDLEPPVLQGGPVSLPLGPAGVVSMNLQNLGVTVTDNCAFDQANINPGSFDCLQIGTHVVVITAFDEAGNSASLSIQVTITDNLPPNIECPQDIRRCATDHIVEYLAPVATDNCLMLGGFFNLVEGLPSGSEFPEGATKTTYSFTDASGNSSACSFWITILPPLTVTLDAILHDKGAQGVGGVLVSVGGSLPGYTFEWQRDGQTVAQTEDLTGVGAGSYTLQVTDAAGCTTLAGPFVVDNLVGTSAPDWAGLVSVFPNPASGLVYVSLPAHLTGPETRLYLHDLTGKILLEYAPVRQNPALLDCSAFPAGIYTLSVRTAGGQAAYRIALAR